MPLRPAAARSLLLAAVAALAGCASGPAAPPAAHAAPRPAAQSGEAALPAPTTPEGWLPGVPLDQLTEPQKAMVAAWARETYCYCGCPHTVSEDLRRHQGCTHAPRMARLATKLALAGVSAQELARVVTDYYASFEAPKRAKLDAAGFGPPLGEPGAKVTLVEFSDFTCPYCQLFRPQLEQFVADRPGQVKLVYKPFPIESHPGALEAAQAAEWAREKGIFWPFHDQLFGDPHAPVDRMGEWARELGQDPADLAAALSSQRLLPRVRASQAEGRAAGMRGTPTLYLDGRRLTVPDLSEWMLEFTLQDELEWVEHAGWTRD